MDRPGKAPASRANRKIRVAVLIDLERRAAAGGHVKFWEQIAGAAANHSELELTLHFHGRRRGVERWAENVTVQMHRPVLSSAWLPGLTGMPDHSDLAPWHPGLAGHLRDADIVHCTDTLFAFARTARRWCSWRRTPLVTSLHTDSVAYCELYARETVGRWLRVPGESCASVASATSASSASSRAARLAGALARGVAGHMERRARRHLEASAHVFASGECMRVLMRSPLAPYVSQLRRGLDSAVFTEQVRDGHGRAAVRHALGIPDSAAVLCFAGRLSVGKQVMRVARTAAALVAQGYDVHAVFAGQGPQAAAIRELLGTRAHLLGQVPQQQLADVLRAADLFVFPSPVEIWANAAAEARACGLPVLVDARGGGQLVARSGCDGLVVADDDVAWTEATRGLLDSSERRQAMRQAGLHQHALTVPSWADVLNDDLLSIWRQCATQPALERTGTADVHG